MALNPVVILCSIGMGLGLVGIMYSLAGSGRTSGSRSHSAMVRRLIPATIAAILILLLTRWPVAALMGGIAVALGPALLRRTSVVHVTDKIEAVAVWTELLRDALAASAGLGEAIVTTAPVAPNAIRKEVLILSERVVNGIPLTDALEAFAAHVDDSSCDMVACALRLAASSRAQRLTDLLGSLSESIREDVAMRLRIESSRASARSSVRTVIVFSLAFVAALMVMAHSYLTPFGTPMGQLVLAAVGGCYAAGIALMARLVRPPKHQRLFGAPAEGGNPS